MTISREILSIMAGIEAMAEPRAATHLGQQIGGVGHAFHADR